MPDVERLTNYVRASKEEEEQEEQEV